MNPKTEFSNRSRVGFKRNWIRQTSVLLLCVAVAKATAQTHTVTNCTETALRAAMADGGTVAFACDGTIWLSNTITNLLDVVLDGSGHSITISGNNTVRVFVVPTNVTLTLKHLTIADGVTSGWVCGGGGLLNLGTVNATDCNFWNNAATNLAGFGDPGAAGGAIYNNGSMNLDLCEFEGNRAVGGLYLVNECMDWGADGYGGAIYNSGVLVVRRSDFTANWAEGGVPDNPDYPYGFGYGGAMVNVSPQPNAGTLWLDSSTIENNTAWPHGGGLANFSDATIANTTFVGNASVSGAIYDQNGFAHLTNCTLAFNHGPGITSVGAFLINTLLVTNSGNCSGWITDGGHNLSSDASCAFTNVGSVNITDPKLGPLADNGGPTLTMALLSGSPAIDAGDNSAAQPTDQRGFPRVVGPNIDIGAYERCYLPMLRINPPQTNTISILAYGLPDQSCRLMRSGTLVNWLSIATNQISAGGTTVFQDGFTMGQTCCFYRVIVP